MIAPHESFMTPGSNGCNGAYYIGTHLTLVPVEMLDPKFFSLLTSSYARLVGAPLVEPGCDASWLYEQAPFAVLAHNTDRDPCFIYANKTAQRCFEYSWDEFM